MNDEIGEQLRALRVARNLTLEQVAERLGWSYSNLAKKERGTVAVTVDDLAAWTRVLGVGLQLEFTGDGVAPVEAMTTSQREVLRTLLASVHRWDDARCAAFIAMLRQLAP